MTRDETQDEISLPTPHVIDKPNNFTKSKISFPLNKNRKNIKNGDIIKAENIAKIIAIDNYTLKAHTTIGKIVKMEKIRTKRRELSIREETEIKAWEKTLHEIQRYQENQKEYFDLIEGHCINIVENAIKSIADKFDDELKICSTIESIISKTKNENNATIVIHPTQEIWAAKLAVDNDWNIETNPNIDIDQCELKVMNGCYRSSFTGKLKALLDSLHKDTNDKNLPDEFLTA